MPDSIAIKYGYSRGADKWASGNIVIVDHGDSTATAYSHLSEVHVRAGQRVDGGMTLGLSGMTGRSTGPHLHFEFMTLPINYNSLYYSRLDPMAQYGGASIVPVGAVTQKEDPGMSFGPQDQVFTGIDGKPVSLEGQLRSLDRKISDAAVDARTARQEATEARALVSGLLSTQLPDPLNPGKTYALADHIIWSGVNAQLAARAAGAAQEGLQAMDPQELARAVVEAQTGITAEAVAEQLQVNITTKEASK